MTTLRRGARDPESKHRFATGADPEERRLTLPGDMREGEANDFAIESHGLVEITHGEMDFEQIERFNHRIHRAGAIAAMVG